MRELAVYYCIYCGYYAYYQSSKNTRCPKCNIPMELLETSYRDFIELDYPERDELLSKELGELEAANKKANHTVMWMHQTIWELLKQSKDQNK